MTTCVQLKYCIVHDDHYTIKIWDCTWRCVYSYNMALNMLTSVNLKYGIVRDDMCTITEWYCHDDLCTVRK